MLSPQEWHGAGACAKWLIDFDANAKQTLSKASHVEINCDHVVIPANYTFQQKGKPVSEVGSIIMEKM